MDQSVDENAAQGIKIAVSIDAIGCNLYCLPSNYIYPDQMFTPGGIDLIDAVQKHIDGKYNLHIGRLTANIVLKKIGSALPLNPERTTTINSIELSSAEIREAMSFPLRYIIKNIADAVPSIAKRQGISDEDLSHITIVLCGEFSYLKGLDQRLQEMTGLKVIVE